MPIILDVLETNRFALYNGALLELGERRLADITDETESRRALDDAWEGGDFLKLILQQGYWNFAMRTVELAPDETATPLFGMQYAFAKPEDWVRTAGLSGDDRLSVPLNDYVDEQGFWFADLEPIYVRYVSMDADYGGDFSLWPPSFTRWAQVYLASRVARRLTGSADVAVELFQLQNRLLTEARSHDAMNEATQFLPSGSWSSSRRGRTGERGNRGRLIG
jgi:hypothetical protein